MFSFFLTKEGILEHTRQSKIFLALNDQDIILFNEKNTPLKSLQISSNTNMIYLTKLMTFIFFFACLFFLHYIAHFPRAATFFCIHRVTNISCNNREAASPGYRQLHVRLKSLTFAIQYSYSHFYIPFALSFSPNTLLICKWKNRGGKTRFGQSLALITNSSLAAARYPPQPTCLSDSAKEGNHCGLSLPVHAAQKKKREDSDRDIEEI